MSSEKLDGTRRVPRSFIARRHRLTWPEVVHGLEQHWLTRGDVIEYAAEAVARGDASENERAMASKTASTADRDEFFEMLGRLRDEARPEEPREVELTWMRLMLAWVYEQRDVLEDPLGVVEGIYASFGYPEEMQRFVRYLPMGPNDAPPKDGESWTDQLMRFWHDYVVACAADRKPR